MTDRENLRKYTDEDKFGIKIKDVSNYNQVKYVIDDTLKLNFLK